MDAELIADLGERTFRDAFGADNDPVEVDRYVGEAFSTDTIARQLKEPHAVFLLGYDGQSESHEPLGFAHIIGYSACEPVASKSPIELARLYVKASARGQGRGSDLLRECLKLSAASGFETIWLGVWEKNHGARRFYERWDFVEVGAHTFMLGREAQRDLLMARPVLADN